MDTLGHNVTDTRPAQPIPHPSPAGDHLISGGLIQGIHRPDRVTVVLTLHGVIDAGTAPQLAEMLQSRLHSQLERVVLDLSGVAFLAVAGISVLIQADLRAQYTGITLELVSDGNRQVERALTVTAEHHQLRLHPGPAT